MADIALTSAVYLSGAAPLAFNAGAAIAATDVVYFDDSSGSGKLADADVLASSYVSGVALNASASGNPVNVAGAGTRITVNAVLTKGVAYYASTTAGKICPFADLTSGKYISLVGIAESTTVLRLICVNLGVAV